MGILATKRRERGEINQADLDPFLPMSIDELFCKLHSVTPTIRTCAATVLGKHKDPEVVAALCQQIKIEKKLYCRIAISDSLVNIGSLSVQPLLALLGKVGHNQETDVPQKGFNKISYPLPRDIAARILCRMGGNILSEVFRFLDIDRQPSELGQAIDVIGHIVYTEKLKVDSKILIRVSEKYCDYPIIQFKITRCFSGFTDSESQQFLRNRLKSLDIGFQFEAVRSLVLSGQHLQVDDFELSEDVLIFTKQLTRKLSRCKKPRL